ncbi:MAG: hypothetical protein KDC52_11105 [Ignavibacteriae bacterium]|nr:hypothetical protein [Ignavibacteriota bacterium]MCB9250794.1 hypothetical protein [Ignavibacteriales bacterium]
MVSLETQKSIIRLGEQIVKELKLDSRGDTISRWMANYIAEQITIAKKSTGTKKRNVEKKCFETILKFWESRSHLPNRKRPFEKFEIISETLEKISPDNITPYYYTENDNSKSKKNKKLKNLLEIAEIIDEAARVWLEHIFSEAIKYASTKEVKNYVKNALHFKPNNDITVLVKFLAEDENNEKKNKAVQEEIERLKFRLQQIENFVAYSEVLKNYFEIELEKLNKEFNNK